MKTPKSVENIKLLADDEKATKSVPKKKVSHAQVPHIELVLRHDEDSQNNEANNSLNTDENGEEYEDEEEREIQLFYAAIDADNLTTVKALLDDIDNCINVETVDDTGQTGLIRACRNSKTEIAEFLIDRGSDVDAIDDDGWCALLNSCRNGDTEIVEQLISAGANVHATDLWAWNGASWAAYKNRLDVLKLMIEHKVQLDIIDEDNLTPLMYACGRGYHECAIILLQNKVNLNISDKFGNTPLLWACRKSCDPAAKCLLERGSDIHAVGMEYVTPLIMSVKNNCPALVDEILKRQPTNINACDQNGMSALSHAARNGYVDMVYAIMETQQANVNQVDNSGDAILMHATRSGHAELVHSLLKSGADLNVKDGDDRTPMHVAVDKNYIDIVLVLLEYKPQLEIRAKDGDTCLIRAVKKKNALVAQLLVRAGARISAATPQGDNCLHIAMRSRSKRLTQLLLARPNDARMLYRPNSAGETPYSIDKSFPDPILPHIFGPVESQAQTESMMGYDVYSNVIADILCEPNLNLPLSIGLYAKWGSGKSFLLNKMKESMTLFSRSWVDEVELTFSLAMIPLVLFIGTLVSLIVYIPLSAVYVDWLYPLLTGLFIDVLLFAIFGLIYYGSQVREWPNFYSVGTGLAKILARMRLISCILFYHPPTLHENDQLACPVSFLFADYHRLSSVGGEEALTKIVYNLHEALEGHFGKITTRLWFATRPTMAQGQNNRLRRACGIPILLATLLLLSSLMLCLFLFVYYYHRMEELNRDKKVLAGSLDANLIELAESRATAALATACALLAVTVLLGIYPVLSIIWNVISSAPRRHLREAGKNLDRIRFEGFMERLQNEVTAMASLVACMDSFTRSQTRLVIFVDGLDNCEQERMVQTLDALELLFCARHDQPYVVVIAVDPHIIISAINHNIKSALIGTELTGHDYLKNIIQMPFYLQNAALRHLMEKLRHREESLEQWKTKFMRSETIYGSYLSLAAGEVGPLGIGSRVKRGMSQTQVLVNPPVTGATVNHVVRDDYFSNINPRSMKRIVNTLNLTGRLMRAFEVDFSWLMLGQWISLVEQWPYRMSWIIDFCEENPEISDSTPIKTVYDRIKVAMPMVRTEDPLMELDRNPQNLEMYLTTSSDRLLTVGHMRNFVPCTSNLDPYIRKLIKERKLATEVNPIPHSFMRMNSTANENCLITGVAPLNTSLSVGNAMPQVPGSLPLNINTHQSQAMQMTSYLPSDVAQYLFEDPSLWTRMKRLSCMSPKDIADAVKSLSVAENLKQVYEKRIVDNNLSGLVLSVCDLGAIREELKMTLGDFTLFRLLIETLRYRQNVNIPQIEHLKSPRFDQAPMNQRSPLDSPISTSTGLTHESGNGVRKRGNYAGKGRAKSIEQKEAEAQMEWLENRVGHLDAGSFKGDLDLPYQNNEIFAHRDSYPASISSNCSKHGSVRFMDTAIEIDDERMLAGRQSSKIAVTRQEPDTKWSFDDSEVGGSLKSSPRHFSSLEDPRFPKEEENQKCDDFENNRKSSGSEQKWKAGDPESDSDSSGDSNVSQFGDQDYRDMEDQSIPANPATSKRLQDAVRHLDRQLSTYSLHKKVPAVTKEDEEEERKSAHQRESMKALVPAIPIDEFSDVSYDPALRSPTGFAHRNFSGASLKNYLKLFENKVRNMVDVVTGRDETLVKFDEKIDRKAVLPAISTLAKDESASSDPDSLSTYSEEHQLTIKKRPDVLGPDGRPSILPRQGSLSKALSDPTSINATGIVDALPSIASLKDGVRDDCNV